MRNSYLDFDKKLTQLIYAIPLIESEVDRHRLLFKLRELKLEIVIAAVRAANSKEFEVAENLDRLCDKFPEARKAIWIFDLDHKTRTLGLRV